MEVEDSNFQNFPGLHPWTTTVQHLLPVQKFLVRTLVHPRVDLYVQNELKLTYGHLPVQNFSGGYTPGPPRRGEREGRARMRWEGGKGEEREGQDGMTEEGKLHHTLCGVCGAAIGGRKGKIGGVLLHCSWGMDAPES